MSVSDTKNEHKNTDIEKLKEPAYIREGWLGFPWIFWGVVFLYGVSIIFYGFQLGWIPSVAVADWGQFGDFFGGFINPVVGLVTIVLFAASLKDSRISILQTEQALKQNGEILKATLEELSLTRLAVDAGQKIQKDTEATLKEQIDVAIYTRDMSNAVTLYENFEGRIAKIFAEFESLKSESVINPIREVIKNQGIAQFSMGFERQRANAVVRLDDNIYKMDEIRHLLDHEHSRLVDEYSYLKNK